MVLALGITLAVLPGPDAWGPSITSGHLVEGRWILSHEVTAGVSPGGFYGEMLALCLGGIGKPIGLLIGATA